MSSFKKFTFQESKIWESGNPVDTTKAPVNVKAKTEERARRRLPKTTLGRTWLLIENKS